MSSTNTTSSVTDDSGFRSELIDKILNRGHRLRNAMVQSILDHDPFNTEIYDNFHTKSLVPTRLRKGITSQCSSLNTGSLDVDKQMLTSFLKGESMNRKDQIEALETLRSMSSEDICKTTNEAYSSKCTCDTCQKYDKRDLTCDLNRLKENLTPKKSDEKSVETTLERKKRDEFSQYLKHVDSLQVSVHNLVLNDKGNKKLNYSQTDKTMLHWGSQTFFVEYELPFILSVSTAGKRVRKTLTSANNNNNFVRICARQTSTEAVHFKHSSIHNIKNVDQISLQGIKLIFHITCRTMRQKNVIRVGHVIFDFANFESSLSYIGELPILCDDTVPIVLGNLRVTLQMGYRRTYFGKEFIACFQENQNVSHLSKAQKNPSDKIAPETKNISVTEEVDAPKLILKETIYDELKNLSNQIPTTPHSKTVLFGFIYVPEAQYTKADINSFITCRPFCQEDICYSELVRNDSNPIFNFSQLVPLIYDEELLQTFRENFMVIEFWEKFETKNILLGLTKLSLTQFYLAYRNADITKYLSQNELPVISSDWWEEIHNPYTDEFVGQVQVLLALGTEKQINNLQVDRGFKTNSVKANFQTPLEKNKTIVKPAVVEKPFSKPNKKDIQRNIKEKIKFQTSKKPVKTSNIEKSTKDQCVQFDSEMDSEVPTKEKRSESSEKLEQILSHLIAMRNQQQESSQQTNSDEKSKTVETTDTQQFSPLIKEIPQSDSSHLLNSNQQHQNMSPLVRSTSDLLSTLQAALSVPPPMRQQSSKIQQNKINGIYKKNPTSFKVHIAINQAMHLPIRKKCKAKRNKGKSVKMDDNVKPSSYVTFETMPGLELKMTPLVQKSTAPEWKFECDAILPAELLTNNEKRLIFKVWRKSTNTNMVPNLQTDSILGFAALDLTVLLSGLPNIKGWFNIIDLSSKCNGQINIHVTPLEDLSVFKAHKSSSHSCTPTTFNLEDKKNSTPVEIPIPPLESSNKSNGEDEGDGEILSRALKRKFAELDEITQRLRLRLSHVTNDETDEDNDEIAEQFERDINTLSIEEDFDMVNFEDRASGNVSQMSDLLKIECSEESSSEHAGIHNALCISTVDGNTDKDVEESLSILDKQLLIGKQRIDTLLGKLSLISGEMNGSRYVSGCSNSEEPVNLDTEAILKDLNRHSRPNIHASTSYDRDVFQQIYEYPENESATGSNFSSNTSVISNLAESRAAPDGEGTLSEVKNRVI